MDGVLSDNKAPEVNGRCVEVTLLSLNECLILQQFLQDSVDKLNMGFWIRGEDQNIIHVDKNKAIKHVSRNIVHQGLKALVVATKGLKS